MPTFEIILTPFNANDSSTDHFTKWVKAKNQAVLTNWLMDNQLIDHVRNFGKMNSDPTFQDGLDVEILENGEFAMVGNPQDWIKEVEDYHKSKNMMLFLNKEHLLELQETLIGTNTPNLLYVRNCIIQVLSRL